RAARPADFDRGGDVGNVILAFGHLVEGAPGADPGVDDPLRLDFDPLLIPATALPAAEVRQRPHPDLAAGAAAQPHPALFEAFPEPITRIDGVVHLVLLEAVLHVRPSLFGAAVCAAPPSTNGRAGAAVRLLPV